MRSAASVRPSLLSEISLEEQDRIPTGFKELDRVLGNGIVAGSLVLVGGDPGIGKSTILLQVCRNLAMDGRKVLYISGEESLKQIKMRANRIGPVTGELRFLSETNLERIEQVLEAEAPQVAVIDSIQTMYSEEVSSAPGSVSQVRESTGILLRIAKSRGMAVFVVGHVTKEGVVAGPRVLEHMVDTVLYFEGDRNASYRILRGVKNRFGSTNEIGVFEMEEKGLVEVENPSEYMLEGRPQDASGAVVSCSMEGTRPILLEVQALVAETNFGMPRRTAAGTDYNRVNLLMAVLEKRCRYEMSLLDAYVNIAGGVRMNEPALDLAIVMALMSSYKDEAATIDGASYFRVFWSIVLPLSKAVLATIALFIAVGKWNDWYTAMLFIQRPDIRPLAYALQKIMEKAGGNSTGTGVNIEIIGESVRSAAIVVAVFPIMIIYPFFQKHFVKGVLIGSIKG